MEPPVAHTFPPRDHQPLHVLSPERMNAARPGRSRRMAATDPEATENPPVSPASPTRRNNALADFSFGGRTPGKDSAPALPLSPSLPEISSLRANVRTNSDVQGLVKRFEHLDVRDRDAENAEKRKRQEAELRRAQVAREEAEGDVKRLREEVRRLRKEGDEGGERERRVAKRLEIMMEEYGTVKETYAAQASIYEKEVRKARKEAFKSSSAVLKLQEELKSTRNHLRAAQTNLDLERRKVQQKEQETFSAQYQYVALQEELERLQIRFRVVEEEKESLKTSLKEEVARIAAEGRIALPPSTQDDEDLLSSPKRSPQKRPVSPLSDDKENAGILTKKFVEARRLTEEVASERRRRRQAEELVDFLSLECHFDCCSCHGSTSRMAAHSPSIAMSDDLARTFEQIRQSMRTTLSRSRGGNSMRERSPMQREQMSPIPIQKYDGACPTDISARVETIEVLMEIGEPAKQEDPPIEIMDESVTMAEQDDDQHAPASGVVSPSEELPIAPRPTPVDRSAPVEVLVTPEASPIIEPQRMEEPLCLEQSHRGTGGRPRPSVRTVTTTTTIPMHFTPVRPVSREVFEDEPQPTAGPETASAAAVPATFDREAALAAIAYRRGRAKSIAEGHMTPRKQMIEGLSMKERRDISAPAFGQKSPGLTLSKGAASVGGPRSMKRA